MYGTGGSYGTVAYPTNYKSLINTCATSSNSCTGINNIRLVGAGTVTGSSGASADSSNSGYYLSTLGLAERAAQSATDSARGDLVSITGSSGVYIKGLKFTLPPEHTLYIARVSNLTIAGINADIDALGRQQRHPQRRRRRPDVDHAAAGSSARRSTPVTTAST